MLRVLALMAAFFAVSGRCFSAFPVAPSSQLSAPSGGGVSELRSDFVDRLALASLEADLDEESEDSAEAVLAPAPVRLIAVAAGDTTGLDSAFSVAQRALSSHAQSLERPPRA